MLSALPFRRLLCWCSRVAPWIAAPSAYLATCLSILLESFVFLLLSYVFYLHLFLFIFYFAFMCAHFLRIAINFSAICMQPANTALPVLSYPFYNVLLSASLLLRHRLYRGQMNCGVETGENAECSDGCASFTPIIYLYLRMYDIFLNIC